MGITGLAKDHPVSGGADTDHYDPQPRRLRARAARYRRLADILCDQEIVAIVLACADELEQCAESLSEQEGRRLNRQSQ